MARQGRELPPPAFSRPQQFLRSQHTFSGFPSYSAGKGLLPPRTQPNKVLLVGGSRNGSGRPALRFGILLNFRRPLISKAVNSHLDILHTLFCPANNILFSLSLSLYFQDIAAYIKKEFDKKYNPTWHCIVGRNFGSYVTHETRHFIYFYLGQVAILLFKSG